MKEKIVRMILMACVALAVQVVGASEQKQKIVESGGYRWQLLVDGNNRATIVGCVDASTGAKDISGALTIPRTVGGYTVVGLGDEAFKSRHNLSSVVIPEGVVETGTNVFAGCISLTSVTIPNTLREIRAGMFFNCQALTSIVIPDSVTNIESGAFSGCHGLTSVTLSKNLTTISTNLFGMCIGLEDVVIPEGVTKIETRAFYCCWELKEVTIPSSVRTVGERAFSGCSGLTELNLKEGLEVISSNAFSACTALASVTIPSTVRDIAAGAFSGCEELKDVTIYSTAADFGMNAFSGCPNLATLTLAPGTTAITDNMFLSCRGLTTINIPSTVTSIGSDAFHYCEALTSVTIPSGVTNIGANAFAGCKALKSIKVPGGVKDLESGVFSYCDNLTKVTLSEGLLNIGGSVFERTPVETITIPSTVTNIEVTAFSASTDLPVMATSSIQLKKVYFNGKPPLISGAEFSATNLTVNPFGMMANGYYSTVYKAEWKAAMDGDETGAWFGLMMAAYTNSGKADHGDTSGDSESAAGGLVELLATNAQTYNAVIMNSAGELVGTLQLRAGKANKRTRISKVMLTVAWAGASKKTYRGEIDADGTLTISKLVGTIEGLEFTTEGVSGTYVDETDSYRFVGARDLLNSKDRDEKAEAQTALNTLKAKGPWTLAWTEGEGDGWNVLSLTLGSKGQTKVTGTLVNGAKVSASVHAILGADGWTIPVAIVKKSYSLRAVVKLSLDGALVRVTGLGEDVQAASSGEGISTGAVFYLDVTRLEEIAGAADLTWDWTRVPGEVEVTVKGTKWSLPKENPSSLRLTYRAKDGSWSGSFRVYEWARGSWKARVVNVFGVVVDGVGYGTAQLKKVGAVGITIE